MAEASAVESLVACAKITASLSKAESVDAVVLSGCVVVTQSDIAQQFMEEHADGHILVQYSQDTTK
eukprot:2330481-Amphidinium_carterae.1